MPSYFDLRALPVEIRVLIFRYCLDLVWQDESMPALIAALRGDRQLYHEALEVFYANNILAVSPDTEKRVASMSLAAMRTIERATVFYGYGPPIYPSRRVLDYADELKFETSGLTCLEIGFCSCCTRVSSLAVLQFEDPRPNHR
jgi:hypothetical protein